MSALAAADWTLVNGRVLAVFGPVLILTGIAGFLIPPRLALMSGAPAYNVFHILFGALGDGAGARARSRRGVAVFNLGFGAADVYQASRASPAGFRRASSATSPPITSCTWCSGSALAAVGWMGLR